MNIFNDKVAIVTGASSGIGQSLGAEIARQGATVVLCARSAEKINAIAKELTDRGHKATGMPLDVRDADAVKTMIDKTVSENGRIDYLFNNAGISVGGPAHKFSLEDWRSVIDTNLYGVVNGVTAAYPIMVEQRFGHIVNVSSMGGLIPFPITASYATSKYGVVGLSHALRTEGAAYGVNVSVVCPGYVITPMTENARTVALDRDALTKAWFPEWTGVTSDQCARIILKGVKRNRGTIVVTGMAKGLWFLNRLSPSLVQFMMNVGYKKIFARMIIQ